MNPLRLNLIWPVLWIAVLSACGKQPLATTAGDSIPAPALSAVPTTSAKPYKNVRQVYVKKGVIYVGHEEGLSVSRDYGVTWTTFRMGSDVAGTVQGVESIAVSDSGTIYVSLKGGVSYSPDLGKTWSAPITGNASIDQNGGYAANLTTDGKVIYASVGPFGNGGFGFSYFDESNPRAGWINLRVGSHSGYFNYIRIFPTQNSVFAIDNDQQGDGAIMRAPNPSSNFVNVAPHGTLSTETVTSLAAAGGNLLLVASDGYFISTNGGGTWTANSNLPAYVSNVVYDGSRVWGTYYLENSAQTGLIFGLFYSDDNGQTFANFPIPSLTAFATFNNGAAPSAEGDILVLGSWGQGVAISTDHGATFQITGP